MKNEKTNRKVAEVILSIILAFSLTACAGDAGRAEDAVAGGKNTDTGIHAEADNKAFSNDDITSTKQETAGTIEVETRSEEDTVAEPTQDPAEKQAEDKALAKEILSKVVVPKEHVLESIWVGEIGQPNYVYTVAADQDKLYYRHENIYMDVAGTQHVWLSYISVDGDVTKGYSNGWYMTDYENEGLVLGDVDTAFIRSLADYSDFEWLNETYDSVLSATISEENGMVTVTAELHPNGTELRIWDAKGQWLYWSWGDTEYTATVRFFGSPDDEEIYLESYELHTTNKSGDEEITVRISNLSADAREEVIGEIEGLETLYEEKIDYLRRVGYSDEDIDTYFKTSIHHNGGVYEAEGSTAKEWLSSYLSLSAGVSRVDAEWFMNDKGTFSQEDIEKALGEVDWNEQGFIYIKNRMLDGIARNYPDKAVAFDEEEWESVTKWMKGEFHFTEENAAYAEKKYKAMIDNAPDI